MIKYIDYSMYYIGESMKRQAKRDPESLLPLPLTVLHILLALADGDKHGYGMMKEVAGRTEGKVRLGPGTLYGGIKRLLENGLIEKSDERPDPELDDERRVYYRLTGFGQRVLGAESQRLAQLVGMARAKRVPMRFSESSG
jgi:DNA-binding PadR family transcriptional regulator